MCRNIPHYPLFSSGKAISLTTKGKKTENKRQKKRIERELEEKQPNIEPAKTQKELTLERETMMVEDLIDELVSKRNKTQRDKDNLDLLRIKLRQLREN